ncbi:signal peptide peptidase SppA [Phormidium sp. FACHB-592]|uniref:Protease 4 n=1 Tax=Stenomitos frigidus AS-A4 TaxID=2933935 RepID=A0ABV0KDM1_9CYAN|nr:signal peptide peptidase SppA [Phormidium sp. FACHB-592]MBD2075921.1 signal peptide peptidase SppA [Phormidium sp. FACHB-592]
MRDFFKNTLATVLGLLIFLGLSVSGLLVLVIAIAARDTEPQVKDKSVLVFDLGTNITDAKRSSSTSQALGNALSGNPAEETISLRAVLDAINEATRDAKIVGIYLYGNEDSTSGTGFATLKEVREALQRFRASGKKIIAYDVSWAEREYYLGSVANTIVLNPVGSFDFNGLSSETMFYAGALKKFGIGVQVTRVGKYKAAVEPFLLTKRSPENRAQTQQLLNDLWGEFLTAAGKDRKLSVQQLQKIADSRGILMANEALKSRLVDKLAYTDEVIADLKKLAGSDEKTKSFRQVNLATYAKIAETKIDRGGKQQIAVVYAEGDIVSGQGGVGSVGGDRLARQLRQIRQDDDVKAVVLRVNSPGGSATASEVIQREVVLTRKAKPLVVSMGSIAASGGYWISTYSDRIFAEPNTITGSIGVFGIQPNFQAIANANGITWDAVKTGRYADSQTTSRPKNPQELAIIQRSVDQIYDQFLTKVADSRKLTKAKVAEIAQGRVWSGLKAKQLGLVDELGGIDAAIRDAAKRANLGDNWQIEEYPKTRGFAERLFEQLGNDAAAKFGQSGTTPDPLAVQVTKLQSDLTALQAMNDPLGVYVRLPFNFRID